MILVHGTSKDSRDKILESNKINPSTFDYTVYLSELFQLGYRLKKNFLLPTNLGGQHAMWLGEGTYAFESTDYELARSWKTRYKDKIPFKDCAVIQLDIDFNANKKNILNMSSKKGKDLIQDFLNCSLAPMIKELEIDPSSNKNELAFYRYIFFLGVKIVREEFYYEPHALGIFVELMKQDNFQEINSYPIIKATFTKNKDLKLPKNLIYLETYICIKDSTVIKEIRQC